MNGRDRMISRLVTMAEASLLAKAFTFTRSGSAPPPA